MVGWLYISSCTFSLSLKTTHTAIIIIIIITHTILIIIQSITCMVGSWCTSPGPGKPRTACPPSLSQPLSAAAMSFWFWISFWLRASFRLRYEHLILDAIIAAPPPASSSLHHQLIIPPLQLLPLPLFLPLLFHLSHLKEIFHPPYFMLLFWQAVQRKVRCMSKNTLCECFQRPGKKTRNQLIYLRINMLTRFSLSSSSSSLSPAWANIGTWIWPTFNCEILCWFPCHFYLKQRYFILSHPQMANGHFHHGEYQPHLWNSKISTLQ